MGPKWEFTTGNRIYCRVEEREERQGNGAMRKEQKTKAKCRAKD
jgi:hypothetical protein